MKEMRTKEEIIVCVGVSNKQCGECQAEAPEAVSLKLKEARLT
jgi:hypothetical protein